MFAFAAVIFAAPLQSAALFRLGTLLIGVGGGLFAVCTLVVAMGLSNTGRAGLALGAWGAVQATAPAAWPWPWAAHCATRWAAWARPAGWAR